MSERGENEGRMPGDRPAGTDRASLFAKIKSVLCKTKADQWGEFGEPFNPEKKYLTVVERVEHLLTLTIPAGTLTLRSSLPVECFFSAGKYTLRPCAAPLYSVELRPSNWDPRILVDPRRRAAASGNQKIDVLAEGVTAESLFKETLSRVTEYKRERSQIFEEQVKRILAELEKKIGGSEDTEWTRVIEQKGALTWYRTAMNDLKVAVGRQVKEGHATYRMVIANNEGHIKNIDGQMANRFFVQIDDAAQNAGLRTLSSLLDPLAESQEEKP